MKQRILLLSGLCATICSLTFLAARVNAAEEPSGPLSAIEAAPKVYHPSTASLPLVQSEDDPAVNSIFKSIKDSEYHINWQEGVTAFQSPNRANNLRFSYLPDGFSVQRRAPEKLTDLWAIHLSLTRLDHDKLFQPNANAQMNVSKKKAHIKHDLVSIEYDNESEGMRQNFIIDQKPDAKPGLTLSMGVLVDGVRMFVDENGKSVSFINMTTGEVEVNYSDLNVWDALHSVLPARFVLVRENEFAITIDDSQAIYPVTVDPISSSPWRDLYQSDSGAKFGFSVAQKYIGDHNYVGLAVGAPYFDSGQTDEGKVFVYYEDSQNGFSTNANWMAESDQSYALFGWSVAELDANQDGFLTDVAIGAPGYDYNGYDKGAVFIFWAESEIGLGDDDTPGTANWSKYGEQDNSQFGYSVAGVYNIKNDGKYSLAVGAPYYNDPIDGDPYYIGKVYIYYGTSSSIDTTAGRTYTGTETGMNLGLSIADAGNVNGDDYGDFILGVPGYSSGTGEVFIYHGSSTGLPSSANRTLTGPQSGCRFGHCVASAGNVNGDSYKDIIIGAPYYDYSGHTDSGGALVYHGSSSGIGSSYDWFMVSDQTGAKFGWSVSSSLDYDVNDYDGVIVGMPYLDFSGYTDSGRVAVWEGGQDGLATDQTAFETSYLQANSHMGYSVCPLNLEYYRGIIVGSPGRNNVAAFRYYYP